MAGALFGEVEVSLFVAGAAFGEVEVSFFVAGAVFADVELSLFVAGAVSGEIWNDSRSAKCFIFSIQNARGEREKLPRSRGGLRNDGFMVGSWSDHSRIMLGSVPL